MDRRDEIKRKANELRKTLAKLDAYTGTSTAAQRDADRKREKRATAKEVFVPPCADPARRAELEADDVSWMMYYFAPESGTASPFTYRFTIQQQEMIEALKNAFLFGGDQAIAASRGEGKTVLCERMVMKYTFKGRIGFTVLFGATGTGADDCLDSMKVEIETNDRLHADYPEICVPVRALENTPNRAHYQIVTGRRHDNDVPYERASSKFVWCGKEIHLPKVPGAPAAGSIIATRGLDAAVRGIKKGGRRVDVAVIDDPDTEETVRSEVQAQKLEDRIDRAIAGLGGQQRRVARVMLTTLQNRTCVSYRFTDPEQKPSWRGKRFRYLLKPPKRKELWEEYIQLQQEDWRGEAAGNPTKNALKFYTEQREAMDEGAEVANPNRRDPDEVSALQSYHNFVARNGWDAAATELDNDPPEETGPIESGITAHRIQHAFSGLDRRVVPAGCKLLTQGIDVQKRGLHWVVRAWMEDATSWVIDYGFLDSYADMSGDTEGVELAIRRTILARMDEVAANPYVSEDGEIIEISNTLIDAGWLPAPVYAACLELGKGVHPAKGHGKSNGASGRMFSPALRRTYTCRPGDNWRMDWQQPYHVWLVNCNADHWKGWEHSRWMTEHGRVGAAYIFGTMTSEEKKWLGRRVPKQAKEHMSFAKHLTAEVEVEELDKSGKLHRYWKVKAGSSANHYLDASYLTDVAASMIGIKLFGESKNAMAVPVGERPTLSQLASVQR